MDNLQRKIWTKRVKRKNIVKKRFCWICGNELVHTRNIKYCGHQKVVGSCAYKQALKNQVKSHRKWLLNPQHRKRHRVVNMIAVKKYKLNKLKNMSATSNDNGVPNVTVSY